MRNKKIRRLAASMLAAGLSLAVTGCFKPSKESVTESEYYQDLKEDYDKVSAELEAEKRRQAL